LSHRIPEPIAICGLIAGALHRNITAARARPLRYHDTAAVAVYRSPSGVLAAMVVCDLRFAAYTGAASCLAPASRAMRTAQSGRLTANLREHYAVLAEQFSPFFVALAPNALHLDSLHFLPGTLPAPVEAAMAVLQERCDLDVDITGYGHGAVTLLAA